VDDHEEASAQAASRALKIRARRLVAGTFVYLDCDAFVIDRMDRVFELSGDAAFARDVGMERTTLTADNIWVAEHRRLGWDLTDRHHNGGVFLARDNARAHQLFDTWWQRWCQFRSAGRSVDQPALDQAIHASEAVVATLPARFNAMFCVDNRLVRNAAVLHFLVSNANMQTTMLGDILHEMRSIGRVSDATIESLRKTRYPWIDGDLPRRQLYAGNYGRACRAVWRRMFGSRANGRASHRTA
jgi:hypothetical protein